MNNKNNTKFESEIKFTQAYKNGQSKDKTVKEVMTLKEQFPASLTAIRDEDLIAGRYQRKTVRMTQHTCDELVYCVDKNYLKNISSDESQSAQDRQTAKMLYDFWATENTRAKVRNSYPEHISKALPSDEWIDESGSAFPLYRICGVQVDFDKLLQLGVTGLKEEIESNKAQNDNPGLYEGMEMALDLLNDVALYYAKQVQDLSAKNSSQERKTELLKMAVSLTNITKQKPQTFREAIQLFWLYAIIADVKNYGRMDVYLGDFLVNDLDKNIISEEIALSYLQSLWKLIAATKTVFESRVIIGGEGRRNPENADRFAMLAMEATRTVLEIEPQLTLRWYEGMDEKLFDKALDVIGEGRTYPMLYNDDINIPSVQKAFEIPLEDAKQYVPFGCGEFIIDHKSVGTPSGVINLLKVLEVTLHNGIDPVTGKQIGLKTGNPEDFKSFQDLWDAYEKQSNYLVDALAEQEEFEYKVVDGEISYVYTSMLYDNCIARGKSLLGGGAKYLGGTLETYGNINTADSLMAIKDVVYDKELFTLPDLVKMLDANFEGYEKERKVLLDVPKFGNDHDDADDMAARVHEHICNYIKYQKNRTGLDSYLNVTINNQANTLLGKWTSASADGRKYSEPMANGNAPSGGSDKNGLTALLNSMAKMDPSIHAGTVQNLKCSRDLLTNNREKFKAMLKTYFARGGTQAMITVVNKDELEKAMVHPEKYSHVFVRVGGFSARFVELSKEVQHEVLSRTLH